MGAKSNAGRVLDHLSENGFQDLNETKFKTEGRCRSGGGTKILVYAVKSYQLRLYGCFRDKSPRKFIVPEGLSRRTTKQIKINSKELLRKWENRHGHQ